MIVAKKKSKDIKFATGFVIILINMNRPMHYKWKCAIIVAGNATIYCNNCKNKDTSQYINKQKAIYYYLLLLIKQQLE